MASAVVALGLSGSASIPARDLDLRGTASLLSANPNAASGNSVTFELPFTVQGPWNDPLTLPDPQIRIERSGAAAPLLDALRNQGAPQAVRSVIERLTGSAQPAPPSAQAAPALAGTSAPAEVAPQPQTAPAATSASPPPVSR